MPAAFIGELHALRREIDGGRIGARGVDKAFATLSDQLASAFAARLSLLERRTANTSQAAALNLSLRTLGQANDALGAGASEAGDLSNLYFDPPSQRVSDLSALGAQVALLDSAGARLRTDSVGPRARRVRPAREQPRRGSSFSRPPLPLSAAPHRASA